MLATEPRPHPLTGHECAAGLVLPPLRGTISVCERLDLVAYHQWIYIDHPDGTGRVPVPCPFVGDFLLFLYDDHGPYCVNWTIKGAMEEFGRKLIDDRPPRSPEKSAHAVRARHAIEDVYYADALIPTVRIVDRDLPEMFVQNIRSIFLMKHRAECPPLPIYAEICERLQASTQTGQRPLDILLSVMRRHDISLETARAAFGRALWHRDVRSDLMDEAIFIDRPLRPELRDPLQVFAPWFCRQKA